MGNPLLRGTPLPVRFLRTQGACQLPPMAATLQHFRKKLENHRTTKNFLQIPYNKALPEDLIREIAEYCVQVCVNAKTTLSGNAVRPLQSGSGSPSLGGLCYGRSFL